MTQRAAAPDVLDYLTEPAGGQARLTAELRWFVPGILPDLVTEWFAALGPGPEEPRRTDTYLLLRDPAVNVKLRQGRLEVKRRLGVLGRAQVGPHTAGSVEQWKKWIVSAPADSDRLDAPLASLRQVQVEKARHRQLFDVNDDGVHPASSGPDRTSGCDAELTRLTVDTELWWTLSLEAFGPNDRMQDILQRTAGHVFASYAPRDLTPDVSQGYPQWLMHAVDILGDAQPPAVI